MRRRLCFPGGFVLREATVGSWFAFLVSDGQKLTLRPGWVCPRGQKYAIDDQCMSLRVTGEEITRRSARTDQGRLSVRRHGPAQRAALQHDRWHFCAEQGSLIPEDAWPLPGLDEITEKGSNR